MFLFQSGLSISEGGSSESKISLGRLGSSMRISQKSGSSTLLGFSSGSGIIGQVSGHVSSDNNDSVPRFPRLDQCAHFHYEYVELPSINVSI